MTSPPTARPIGVFDSGIGGLSVLQALRHGLPHEDFIYLADSGNAPYGDEKGEAFVQERTLAIARWLLQRHDIKALVVACNTATAAAVERLRARGVLTVSPAPDNRRQRLLGFAPDALPMVAVLADIQRCSLEPLFAGFTAQEQQTLQDYLRRMDANLLRELNKE